MEDDAESPRKCIENELKRASCRSKDCLSFLDNPLLAIIPLVRSLYIEPVQKRNPNLGFQKTRYSAPVLL